MIIMASDNKSMNCKGVFITFEGGEGAGKSTHISFLAEVLKEQGNDVLCVREPGGTSIGEGLRKIVLDQENDGMVDEAELLIYEAARAQIVAEVIKPALAKGSVVLCDRFYDSTVAYQAYGRGLDKDFVTCANAFAIQGAVPDRTILLTCGDDAHLGLQRATKYTGADRLENAGEVFHQRVNDGFLKIAQDESDRVRVVRSANKKSETARAIFAQLSDIFPWIVDSDIITADVIKRVDEKYYGNKHDRSKGKKETHK